MPTVKEAAERVFELAKYLWEEKRPEVKFAVIVSDLDLFPLERARGLLKPGLSPIEVSLELMNVEFVTRFWSTIVFYGLINGGGKKSKKMAEANATSAWLNLIADNDIHRMTPSSDVMCVSVHPRVIVSVYGRSLTDNTQTARWMGSMISNLLGDYPDPPQKIEVPEVPPETGSA